MYPEHAAKWYPGLKPGGDFISRYDKKRHRWLDTTGAKNPDNEDAYFGGPHKGASAVNITINAGNIVDPHGMEALLRDHGHRIYREMKRQSSGDIMSRNVV
jgi:hypothetical protein